MTVLIKRYANRKLYNTETSRYITLKGIAELIEAGQDVRVIDNETGDDITSVALSQILVDSERSNSAVPRGLLSNILQRGGDALYGALRRGVDDASDGIGEVRRSVRRLVRAREDEHGRLSDWLASATPDLDHVVQNAVERVLKLLDLPRRSDIEALNENLERVARAVDRLEGASARGRDAAPAARPEPSASDDGEENPG
jgi:polyhydroxyalkanoate synthesis repressor PhaR